jgi:catechol 2,3-dioxygenase-like lactoylglutathione lyase family enzyme
VSAALRCELFPADLDEAVRFYVDVLGFAVVRDERRSPSPYVALERGRVALGLAQRPAVSDRAPRRPPVGVELVLEVDDLAADRARVTAAGWPLVEDLTHQPWGLTDFRLLDPDGYYWRLTTPGRGW